MAIIGPNNPTFMDAARGQGALAFFGGVDRLGASEPRARETDPDTSHAAAESISPKLRQLQADVLAFAAERAVQGFTHIDLNNHFRTTSSTYRTRCSELVEKGFIVDSGERHAYGPDGKGRRHVVWNITPEGATEHSTNSRTADAG